MNVRSGRDDSASLMAFLDGVAIARVIETERMTVNKARLLINAFDRRSIS
jgi:hypothetical protein